MCSRSPTSFLYQRLRRLDQLRVIDLAVLVFYLAVIVGCGCWFATRKRSGDEFMAGGRALPGWAVGLSMFGSYVSSISFLANPGKAFASNWNFFVFSLATPIAALVACRWFVPFYRRTGEVSAYAHLERRFGLWARTYAVACFLLTQVARTGTILYLLALAASPLTGWKIETIIVLTGTLMIVCTIFGGIEAVVWIGVLQSIVLILGPVICLVVLLGLIPGGLTELITTASAANKFSLGSVSLSLTGPTFWVVLMYGLAINLGNFGVDQSYVQRYIATSNEREAKRSVMLTAALYVPVSAFFFFIGTALYVLYQNRPELFSTGTNLTLEPDKAFPSFIADQLPPGMAGLVVAAIFAASLDSNLSSMATLTLCDIYKRYFRPQAGDSESLAVLRLATLLWGLFGIVAALAMTRVKNSLDAWWELAGIFSGGMLGLFLLGMISRRARSPAASTAVVLGILAILWMTLSTTAHWPPTLATLRNPLHSLMTTVVGTLTILLVGLGLARLSTKHYGADRAEHPRLDQPTQR
jgi:solute:Na+ symporter, SSS family